MRLFVPYLVTVLITTGSLSCVSTWTGDFFTLHRDDLVVTVEAIGTLQAVENTKISPPPIPNFLMYKIAHMAPESSEVKKGQPILSFDTSEMGKELERMTAERDQTEKEIEKKEIDLRVQILELEEKLAEARAKLRQSRLKVEVQENLVARLELRKARLDLEQVETESELLQAQREYIEQAGLAQLETLRHRRDRAEQRVHQLKEGLRKMTVPAPRDGLVIYVSNWRGEKKKVGDTVSQFGIVLQIPDLSRMEADAEIDEADAGRVKLGQFVSLRLDTHPDIEYTGRVTEIAPTVQRQSWRAPLKVYRIVIGLDRTDSERMRPGMRLRAEIEVHRIPNILVIPLDTVVPRVDGPVVFVRSGRDLMETPVVLGARNRTMVEVQEGLQEGQQISRRQPRSTEA